MGLHVPERLCITHCDQHALPDSIAFGDHDRIANVYRQSDTDPFWYEDLESSCDCDPDLYSELDGDAQWGVISLGITDIEHHANAQLDTNTEHHRENADRTLFANHPQHRKQRRNEKNYNDGN